MRLSFKKQPRITGRMGVGYPYQITDIKVDGKVVGSISPPTWDNKRDVWIIMLALEKSDIMEDGNPNCTWKWHTFITKFGDEKRAREFITKHKEKILKYPLHYFES